MNPTIIEITTANVILSISVNSRFFDREVFKNNDHTIKNAVNPMITCPTIFADLTDFSFENINLTIILKL